ncbi:HsdM family class I SAM-dependent methyltransferase [Raineya sp.]|jgi:methylase of polypeptide subunit release factors
MASLTKIYDKQKLFGKIYTPRFIVEKILQEIGFNDSSILGKTILDPACGDGRFLIVVAESIIKFSPKEMLKENLEKIYGWDIDEQAVALCRENLNNLTKPLGVEINWNIEVCNSLKKIIDFETTKFDFIIGNPPYIRIQHLPHQERKFIQTFYKFCKNGSTDAYIAFYELCLSLLKEKGICGLITPNTFMYSQAAKAMRTYFAENQNLIKIINYADIQLFDNATTYSAVVIFGKTKQNHFIYEQAESLNKFLQRTLSFEEIRHKKNWSLSVKPQLLLQGAKLKDICKIHVGITTLCDKAYIFPIQEIENEPDYVLANTYFRGVAKIEKAILKPIIKASRLKSSSDKITEYILFPYQKVGGKHKIISEEYLKNIFPLAYEYLCSVKNELDKRDNGKPNPVAWYAFGRSQGLDTSFGKKILFSPMNNKPNFILIENEETTFYSGYCIKYDGDYEFLLQQLNSERLAEFIEYSSRDFRNGWKAYNKKILEEFIITSIPNEKKKTPKNDVKVLSIEF